MNYNTFYHPCSSCHKWQQNKATATPTALFLLLDIQKNKRRAWQHGNIFKKSRSASERAYERLTHISFLIVITDFNNFQIIPPPYQLTSTPCFLSRKVTLL